MPNTQPTWDTVREAIRAGKGDEALKALEQRLAGARSMHDRLISHIDDILSDLAGFGEDQIDIVYRRRYTGMVKALLDKRPSTESILEFFLEDHRNHYSEFTVKEEPDRYVLTLDPCGSGGRLMRTKNVDRIQKPHVWSWGRSGVPGYCPHCCIAFELIPIELRGYPIAVIECPARADAPCLNYYYKKPELIPEKYFTRIGKQKTIF